MMHAARLTRSERLRRVLALLQDGEEHSTLDIIQRANVCAVNSIISELRVNVWYYKLAVKRRKAA